MSEMSSSLTCGQQDAHEFFVALMESLFNVLPSKCKRCTYIQIHFQYISFTNKFKQHELVSHKRCPRLYIMITTCTNCGLNEQGANAAVKSICT